MSSNVDQATSNPVRESIWSKLRRDSGVRLREERSRLDLSQGTFAEKVGVHRRTQVNYEAGDREPDAAYYEAAAALGVDVHYVVHGERLEGLPAFAVSIARRLFSEEERPEEASSQAIESLFHLFALDELEEARSGAYTITHAEQLALVRCANKSSHLFENAAEAVNKYSTRLHAPTPADLAKLILESIRRYESTRQPSNTRDAMRLIADDVVDEFKARQV